MQAHCLITRQDRYNHNPLKSKVAETDSTACQNYSSYFITKKTTCAFHTNNAATTYQIPDTFTYFNDESMLQIFYTVSNSMNKQRYSHRQV